MLNQSTRNTSYLALVGALTVFSFLATQALAESVAAPPSTGTTRYTLVYNDVERDYLLHIPAGHKAATPVPLMVVLHGGLSNASKAMKMTGMTEKADAENFIAVFPNGGVRKKFVHSWNSGFSSKKAERQTVDDVGFIRVLVDTIAKAYAIDKDRIYATGFSNGAIMTYRLACEMSDVFAAIGPVAGAIDCEPCKPTSPVSVIALHGSDDKAIKFIGGSNLKHGDTQAKQDWSVQHAISTWVKLDACSAVPERKHHEDALIEQYDGGTNGAAVWLCTIQGGKHAWPGGRKEWIIGQRPSKETNATDLIWSFFESHPKAQPAK